MIKTYRIDSVNKIIAKPTDDDDDDDDLSEFPRMLLSYSGFSVR